MRARHFALKGTLAIALALALLISSWGAPWSRGVRPAMADDKAGYELEIGEEDVAIEDFLRMVHRVTKRNLVWNPSDKNIRGKKIIGGVHLKGRSTDELFSLAQSLLTFYELVMIPIGPTNEKIHLVMDARQTSSILKLKPEHVVLTDENLSSYETRDGLFITTTIRVKHMGDLRNARNALTRIVTGQNIGNVTEVPDASAFVVTDFAPNACAIYRLLREMDVPNPNSSTTSGLTVSVQLEHAAALDLAANLSRHFQTTAPAAARNANAPAKRKPDAPRITADERTNQLLVTGTQEQIDIVKHAVTLLDVAVESSTQGTHYHKLRNVRADEAANALLSLIHASPTGWGTGHGIAGRPGVVAHEETNALLISASEEDYAKIRRLLDEMDVGKDKPEK